MKTLPSEDNLPGDSNKWPCYPQNVGGHLSNLWKGRLSIQERSPAELPGTYLTYYIYHIYLHLLYFTIKISQM